MATENARGFEFFLTDTHGELADTTGASVKLSQKKNGKLYQSTAEAKDEKKGHYTVLFAPDALVTAGEMDVQFIISKDGEILKSAPQKISVYPALDATTTGGGSVLIDFAKLDEAVKVTETIVADAKKIKADTEVVAKSARETKETVDQKAAEVAANAKEVRETKETFKEITASEAARKEAETVRASAEEERAQSEATRNTAEEAREKAEAERKTNETMRKDAEQARGSAEETRKDAETKRTNAETERAAKESARVEAEDARAQAETTRKSDEATRQAAEEARKKAEQIRVNQEQTRDQSEETRASAEQARRNAEEERKDAESARQEAENTRADEESKRQAQEAARIDAEKARASEEETRKTAEEERATKETARQGAETERGQAETARTSAEKSRADAESARATAETKRTEAEKARATAEGKRDTAESARASAETERESKEQSRITAEGKRASAETTRKSAEDERIATQAQNHQIATEDHAKITSALEVIKTLETGQMVAQIAALQATVEKDTKRLDTLLEGATDETLDQIAELAEAIKNGGAKLTALTEQLATKATADELKAAREALEKQIGTKASASDLASGLAGKVDTATHTVDLSKKADKATVETMQTEAETHYTDASVTGDTLRLIRKSGDETVIQLPKGFSGKYADLTGAPNLNVYQMKEAGKGLSSRDFTAEKDASLTDLDEIMGYTLEDKDEKGNYRKITYTRGSGKVYTVCEFHGAYPYPTYTVTRYKADGVTVRDTMTYTLTWDTDENRVVKAVKS